MGFARRDSRSPRPASGRSRRFGGRAEILEARCLLAVAVQAITPTEGVAFTGPVATFAATDIAGDPAAATATIRWGDGTSSAGTIEPVGGQAGTFQVVGTHTFPQNGPEVLRVELQGAGVSSASGAGQVSVAASAFALESAFQTATVGRPFSGVVATFTDPNLAETAGEYTALITWADGMVDAGVISQVSPGAFAVSGSHTFAEMGSKTVSVRVVERGGADSSVDSTFQVVLPPITALGTTIAPTVGQAFSGRVASFFDDRPGASAGDYLATIAWGDGQTDVGRVVASAGAGFDVLGTHTYDATGGSPSVTVTIVRAADNQSATATTGVTVASAGPFSIRLDPRSDTGISATDGITRVPIPRFVGAAAPFAVVTLYARHPGTVDVLTLGQTIADGAGLWGLTSVPLSDGIYVISGSELPPGGFPNLQVADYSDGLVTIDTVGPRVTDLSYDPAGGLTTVTYTDNLSGLILPPGVGGSAANPSSYAVVGPRRLPSPTIAGLTAAAVVPNDPRVVTAGFRVVPPVRGLAWRLRILSGGVADLAGNPLDGEFHGRFPSGNGLPGGVFLGRLGMTRASAFRRHR